MRHSSLKTAVSLMFVLIMSTGSVFASDDGIFASMVSWIDMAIKLLSWVWMVLAVIAGKLMTNEFVYGTFIGLDIHLWRIWNIVKNFANFGLGFMFIALVAESLFSSDTSKIRSVLPKALFAGVLINASWFIMGAIMDIVTIMVAAVGSFPGLFLDGEPSTQKHVLARGVINTEYTLTMTNEGDKKVSFDETGYPKEFITEQQQEEFLDFIMPRHNQVSGPLLYLWSSVFRFQDYRFIGNDKSPDYSAYAIVSLIKIGVQLIFSVFLLLLIVINVVRMLALWMFIAFSPIMMLLAVFESKLGQDSEWGILGFKAGDFLSFSKAVGLMFQPVLAIGGMGLMMIFVMALSKVLVENEMDLEGSQVKQNAENSTLSILDEQMTISVEGSWLHEVGGDTATFFGSLVLSMFTLFLMWQVVRMSTTQSGVGSMVKDLNENIMDSVKNYALSAKITLPGGKQTSVGGLKEFFNGKNNPLLNSINRVAENDFRQSNRALEKYLGEIAGVDNVTRDDYSKLADALHPSVKNNDSFISTWKSVTKGHAIADNKELLAYLEKAIVRDYGLPADERKLIDSRLINKITVKDGKLDSNVWKNQEFVKMINTKLWWGALENNAKLDFENQKR